MDKTDKEKVLRALMQRKCRELRITDNGNGVATLVYKISLTDVERESLNKQVKELSDYFGWHKVYWLPEMQTIPEENEIIIRDPEAERIAAGLIGYTGNTQEHETD
jgi:hypothetical protein